MRRLLVVIGMIVALMATAGCSTAPVRSTSPPSSTPARSSAAARSTLPPATWSTTTTPPPRLPPLPQPPPLPVGTTATLSDGSDVVSDAFTVHCIWTNVTPALEAGGPFPLGTTLPGLLRSLFTPLHLPTDADLAWVGLDFTVTNNGQTPIEGATATGPGVPVLTFIINDYGATANQGTDSDFLITGFAVGLPDCPFPAGFGIQGFLGSGHTWSGCVALAVPAGVTVTSVGFVLGPHLGTPAWKVAQWNA
jgi:hypothetical protein